MSVWKNAAKSHQKTHRERHQPESRKHLGLLEKKKDYVTRAKDYNEKKATLKVLQKRALNKNPDEFYHHMINSKVESGRHIEKEGSDDEDTPEQLLFKYGEDLKYITFKRTQELKKIERLQAELHMTNMDHTVKNKHIIFPKNQEDEAPRSNVNNLLSNKELPDVDLDVLQQAAKKKEKLYNELAKRIERERQLAIVQEKLEMQRKLKCAKNLLKPKRIQKGTKDSAPVFKWKYERKK